MSALVAPAYKTSSSNYVSRKAFNNMSYEERMYYDLNGEKKPEKSQFPPIFKKFSSQLC